MAEYIDILEKEIKRVERINQNIEQKMSNRNEIIYQENIKHIAKNSLIISEMIMRLHIIKNNPIPIVGTIDTRLYDPYLDELNYENHD